MSAKTRTPRQRRYAYLHRLERRIVWLETRIEQSGDRAGSSYDRAELNALRYVVSIVRAAETADIIDDLEAVAGVDRTSYERQ